MQDVLRYRPLDVGAAFAPVTLVVLLISPVAGKLAGRVGVRRPLAAGRPRERPRRSRPG
jgi:hypothetical protein